MARAWTSALLLAIVAVSVGLKLLQSPSSSSVSFPSDPENKLQTAHIQATDEFLGPESLAFDSQAGDLYSGVADGRVMRWNSAQKRWSEFAHTSPHRSAKCNPGSPPVLNLENEPLCGRPLGMRFDKNGDLYIADAYYGLLVVGPEGGLAKSLVTEAEGVPLAFTNDVDFGEDGLIYFTDSSSRHHRRDFVTMFMDGDDSGRLLTYNLQTGETKVVLRGLQFANGIAMSQDKSFLVMSETLTCRVLRYWLSGPNKGTLEHFAALPGYPDNIRRTERGDFWVAIHVQPNVFLKLPLVIRRALLKLPVSLTGLYTRVAGKFAKGMVMRLSQDGEILEVLEDREGRVVKLVSEVEEKDGKLYLGSVIMPQIAVYNKDSVK